MEPNTRLHVPSQKGEWFEIWENKIAMNMNKLNDLDLLMRKFRYASRELFNHYFCVENPYATGSNAWVLEERFREVERSLFRKLVGEPMSFPDIEYGELQQSILIKPRYDGGMPILVNRQIDSGYWDYPQESIDETATMLFLCFFDWEQLDGKDNRYVRVLIGDWPSHPEIVGKHGLIEFQYAKFGING